MSEKIDAVYAARRANRPENARSLAAAALAAARAEGSTADLVGALRAHGQPERDAGQMQAALAAYQKAVAILADSGPAIDHAHALRDVGELYAALDDPDRARPALRSALDFYDAHAGDARAGDVAPLDHANALRAYALLHERLGEAAGAQSTWSRARALYEACGVAEGVRECDAHLRSSSGGGG